MKKNVTYNEIFLTYKYADFNENDDSTYTEYLSKIKQDIKQNPNFITAFFQSYMFSDFDSSLHIVQLLIKLNRPDIIFPHILINSQFLSYLVIRINNDKFTEEVLKLLIQCKSYSSLNAYFIKDMNIPSDSYLQQYVKELIDVN